MSDGIDSIPVQVQQRVISAMLNSQILQNFTTGIYTVVYAWTMYLYASRKGRRKLVVVSAISILYLLNFLNWIIQLYFMDQGILVSGETREAMFIYGVLGLSPALVAFFDFIFYSGFAVADALLIWRCYHVWGNSLRIIFVPLALLLAEIGLTVWQTVLFVLLSSFADNAHTAELRNGSISALVLASFATTVITTCLIGYRIHTATCQNSTISKHRFRYIVVMIVESAVVASINLLVLAIFTVVPSFSDVNSPQVVAVFYVDAVAGAISGMVPTILMARLAVKSPDGDTISAPTFILPPNIPDVESGSAPGAGENSDHQEGADGEPHSADEIQEVARESVHGANAEGNRLPTVEEVTEILRRCNGVAEDLQIFDR